MNNQALFLMGCLLAGPAMAAPAHRTHFLRDSVQEEYLKVQADPDQKITPARVIRWLRGMSSVTSSLTRTTSSTEFQPSVDTHNGDYRVIAAITYKF